MNTYVLLQKNQNNEKGVQALPSLLKVIAFRNYLLPKENNKEKRK